MFRNALKTKYCLSPQGEFILFSISKNFGTLKNEYILEFLVLLFQDKRTIRFKRNLMEVEDKPYISIFEVETSKNREFFSSTRKQ